MNNPNDMHEYDDPNSIVWAGVAIVALGAFVIAVVILLGL